MTKRQHKACSACGDHFTTYKNYDYCANCAVNNNRYSQNNCAECGDGSGQIKFPGQKVRRCKLCYLTKNRPDVLSDKTKKPTKLTKEETQSINNTSVAVGQKYWDQVDLLAQDKIYQLFTTNIPFQNIPLITEPWKFEDRQQKLTGLFLDRDVDYRTLLVDMSSQYDKNEEELPAQDYLAEEITLWYCRMVIKSLIEGLSDYSGYDPSYFENLTPND